MNNLKRKYTWDGTPGYTSFTSATAAPAAVGTYDFSRDDYSATPGSSFTTGYVGGYTAGTAGYGTAATAGQTAATFGGYSSGSMYGRTQEQDRYATTTGATGYGATDATSLAVGGYSRDYTGLQTGGYASVGTAATTAAAAAALGATQAVGADQTFTRDQLTDNLTQKWYGTGGGYGTGAQQPGTLTQLTQQTTTGFSRIPSLDSYRTTRNTVIGGGQEGYWGVQGQSFATGTWNQQIKTDGAATYGASPAKMPRSFVTPDQTGLMQNPGGDGQMPGPDGGMMRGRGGWRGGRGGFFRGGFFRGGFRGGFRGRGGMGGQRRMARPFFSRGGGRGGGGAKPTTEEVAASAETVKMIAKSIISVLQGGRPRTKDGKIEVLDVDPELEAAERQAKLEKEKKKKAAAEKKAEGAEPMEQDGDSSAMDMGLQRKIGPQADATDEQEKANRMKQFVEFFKTFPDRVNGIQTISNAVTASKLNLTDEFDSYMLVTLIKPLFTGVLTIGGCFMTRGLGLSKKAVKHDCYERAVQLLRTKSPSEVLALEDCSAAALKREVNKHYNSDYNGFRAFLFEKNAMEMEESEKVRVAAIAESQVPERNFPLSDKMTMLLKELEKPEKATSEEVPVTSRADVLCFKVGISVSVLYKTINPDEASQARRFKTDRGDQPEIAMTCEVYFDDVLVGTGSGTSRKTAQVAAYEDMFKRLKSNPATKLAEGRKLDPNPENLPGFVEILHKGSKQQSGNNMHRLGALKLLPLDETLSPEDMVIIETEGDSVEQNAYKILEFSASKCGLLLEWKHLDKGNTNASYRCEMTLHKKKTVIGVANAKAKARNAAAAQLLLDMYETNDVIRSTNKEEVTNAIKYEDIRKKAEQLKAKGVPRKDRISFDSKAEKEAKEGSDSATDTQKWLADKLRPWIEDAIVNAMDEYTKKVSLEDLVFDTDFPPTARRFVTYAALQMHLAPMQRSQASDNKHYLVIYKRLITPQEMVKILHVCKKKSGRYTLVKANHPFAAAKQKEFTRTFPKLWQAKVDAAAKAEKEKQK